MDSPSCRFSLGEHFTSFSLLRKITAVQIIFHKKRQIAEKSHLISADLRVFWVEKSIKMRFRAMGSAVRRLGGSGFDFGSLLKDFGRPLVCPSELASSMQE